MKRHLLILLAVLLVSALVYGIAYAATYSKTSCWTYKIGGVSQFKSCLVSSYDWSGGVKRVSCTRTFTSYVSGWTSTVYQSWCKETYYATTGSHFKGLNIYKNGVYKGWINQEHKVYKSSPGVFSYLFSEGLP